MLGAERTRCARRRALKVDSRLVFAIPRVDDLRNVMNNEAERDRGDRGISTMAVFSIHSV